MMMRQRRSPLRNTSYFTILFLFTLALAPSVLEAQISGTVFRDFNGNGMKDNSASFNETFVQGIEVKAYNAAGAQVGGTQTTSASGAYSFTGLTLPLRIEFSNLPSGDFSGPLSSQSLSSVQYHTVATTSANLAVNYPAQYCQGSPYLVSPCYVNNRPTGAGTEAIVKYPNTASGTTSVNSYLATASEVGSTWGLAYNKVQQIIYASAFVKRHVSMIDNDGNGTEDIGAIYAMTPTGSPALWLDLATLGVDVGLSLMPSIADRALPTDKTQAARDPLMFDLVGKIGLGDMDISDDSKLLYVVNLFDKKVYTIDVATKTLVGAGIAVPNACTGGTVRPFGLAYHRNKLYVGAVCDGATSQDTADVKANLYRLDGGTFTNILSFPLSYVKGAAEIGYNNQWYAWRSSFYPVTGYINPPEYEFIYPQPIFADIQFDTNEELILVLNDRLGHQTGYQNYGTNATDNNLYTGIVGGDILRAALVNGTYVLERNATVGGVTTAGAGNNQGPGGGEFYFEDKFDPYHEETVMGGAAIMAGSGLVAVNLYDPIEVFSGGTAWMNNQTGTVDRAYQIFKTNTSATFGKANGLGAVAFLCDAAAIEIGNAVWNDANGNGIYDANESGIDGVIVELYDGATKVGTTTTANGGRYLFNAATVNLNGATGVKPNTAYTIKIAASQFNNTGVASTPLSSFTLTTANATSNGLADVADNDATAVSGIATIAYTTGNAGENDHTLDFGFRMPVCLVSITPSVSGCYQSGGVSKATVSVEVAWADAPLGDSIAVTVGSQTKYIKPGIRMNSYGLGVMGNQNIVSPQVVAFEFNADGSNGAISTAFVTNPTCSATGNYTLPAACPALVCNTSAGQTGGIVFNDYDANGIKSSGETNGLSGITVKAFDCNGNQVGGTQTTDAFGKYAFSAITTYPIRVEFSGQGALYGQGTPSGTNGRTTTQFVAAASCAVDLGVLDPNDYCQTNPKIFVPCYLNGDPNHSGSVGEPGIVGVNYDLSGGKSAVATIADIGSVWGMAYNKFDDKLYSATFLRRHVGLTAAGLGGIFRTNINTNTTSLFVDVENIGVNLGSVGDNAARGVNVAKDQPSTDADVFTKIGKVGMGDLDISSDGQTLYFVNLFEKKLHRLDIANPASAPGVAIPDPQCAGGTARPWGLKIYKGFAYVGVVCDAATSNNKSNLRAYIYKYNLTTNTFDNSPILDFPLTYPKGYSWVTAPDLTGWYPWSDDQATTFNISNSQQLSCCQADYGDVIIYPQPILSDIEFDIDGSMILGFADRFSFQTGSKNQAPDGNNGSANNGSSSLIGGDILRAYFSDNTFILENDAKAGPIVGSGSNNNQGIGFGEFYNDDFLNQYLGVNGRPHAENSNGGLALKPGSGEVIYSAMDPEDFGLSSAGGFRKVSNSTGLSTAGFVVYAGNIRTGVFSKSGGIGDPEIACETPTYLQVGNYVWIDTDKDGVQDPCETPLSNLVVSLWKNGTQIASTTTNSSGEYYFSSKSNLANPADWTGTGADTTLLPNMAYEVRIATTQTPLSNYVLTTANATANNGNDQNDNDATISSNTAAISFTTGAAGSVNHTLDFGFKAQTCPVDTGCCLVGLISNGSFETFSGGTTNPAFAEDVTFGDDGTGFVLNSWNFNYVSGTFGVTVAKAKCDRPNPVYYNSVDGGNIIISYRGLGSGTQQHIRMSQPFNVVANKKYSICFYMAPGMKCLAGTYQWIDIAAAGGWTASITSGGNTLSTQDFNINPAHANSSADPTIGQTNPTTWTKQTFVFTATTTGTVDLNFEAYNPDAANSLGAYFLDNVSVCESQTCDTTLTVSNTTICNGSSVNLFAQASGVKGTLTYSTNGTTWAALTNPTNVNPSVSTTYFIKDSLYSSCLDIDTLTITVNQPITAGTGTNPATATCQAGSGLSNINLAGQITGATSGGVWSQTSGTAVGTALNTATGVLNPNGLTVGTYVFRYTVVGTSPCPNATTDITITIQNCCPPTICIPVAVTRN